MAYTPITPSDITAGKAAKEEIFSLIRSNQESFNTDIEALKQTSILDVFNIRFSGEINQYTTTQINDQIAIFKAPVGATFTSFVMTLLSASTSGTLEMQLDKSINNGIGWTALLSSAVQLTGTTVGSISGTVNWVDTPSQTFAQNDLIRLRITGLQTGQGSFHTSIYGELS